MPPRCYSQVNFENFKKGLTVGGKLVYKRVDGGVLLINTEYTIKEDKLKKEIEQFEIENKNANIEDITEIEDYMLYGKY